MKIITAIWIICIVALPMHSMFVNLKLGRSQWIPLLWTGLAVFAGPMIIAAYLFDYFNNVHPNFSQNRSIINKQQAGGFMAASSTVRPPKVISVRRKERR